MLHEYFSLKQISLTNLIFSDEASAVKKLEDVRWAGTVTCPQCGQRGRVYSMKSADRLGLKRCGNCYRTFNVRCNTIFMESRAPMYKWLRYILLYYFARSPLNIVDYCMVTEVSYKTSWSMANKLAKALDRAEASKIISRTTVGPDAETRRPNHQSETPDDLTHGMQMFVAAARPVLVGASEEAFDRVLGELLRVPYKHAQPERR